mmetsp:Transcript_11723/g.38587  ORF Transcript_11723/g.38587 Transcript_11723/m.38587 type:complete len:301 (-) Transcript_11723:15-917(-)
MIEFVYERPATSKGVLLLLHGCHHSATDAWAKSEGCPKCLGLPVETRIARTALARGWTVAAVSSWDRLHKCWSPGQDASRVNEVVDFLFSSSEEETENLPPREKRRVVAAIGASSGGEMVSSLTTPGLVGVVAQIMPSRGGGRTPIRFVHMRKDVHRAKVVGRQVEALKARGVDAEEFLVDERPLTAESFYSSTALGVPALPSQALADDLMGALKSHDDLLNEKGFLVEDPRHSNWRDAARTVVPPDVDSLEPDASPISEILNEAFAFHEFTDAFLDESLDWLDSLLLPSSSSSSASGKM